MSTTHLQWSSTLTRLPVRMNLVNSWFFQARRSTIILCALWDVNPAVDRFAIFRGLSDIVVDVMEFLIAVSRVER